ETALCRKSLGGIVVNKRPVGGRSGAAFGRPVATGASSGRNLTEGRWLPKGSASRIAAPQPVAGAFHEPRTRPFPSHGQRHSRAVDGCGAGGEHRPSRYADGHGRCGDRAV